MRVTPTSSGMIRQVSPSTRAAGRAWSVPISRGGPAEPSHSGGEAGLGVGLLVAEHVHFILPALGVAGRNVSVIRCIQITSPSLIRIGPGLTKHLVWGAPWRTVVGHYPPNPGR